MSKLPPRSITLDPEILEVALEADELGQLGRDALLGRFPDRPAAVDKVMRALHSYLSQVQQERSSCSGFDHGQLLEVGTTLGDYRIEGLLGSGGMGVVYRATQIAGGHQVAIKVLRSNLVERDRSAVGRFHREAELLADVVHPNLARTFGTCVEGQRIYFAMELVEGRTLGHVLQRLALVRQLGGERHECREYVRRIVLLISKIARALSAIHERGLIHRDVKPSNIMLRGAGDDDLRALGCEPVLVDQGLLRPAEPSDLTSSQTLLGTPAFVSPEARLGREVDARSDVFSLGVVLYDLLTLTAPGRRRIASSGLSEVSAVNPAVDKRLSAIVARAMEDRPGRRYADGATFERELMRYFDGKSIRALPGNPLGRLWLVARRHPVQAALGGSALAVLLVVLLVLAGGEIRRGLGLRDRVREAHELEQAGQLFQAWQSWNTLPSQTGLLDGLLGSRDELEWASAYWSGEFGKVCARFADKQNPERSHEGLRTILLSSEDKGQHFETVLRFLVHELGLGDQHRVRSAAKTVAIYFMIRPLGWGETLMDEALDQQLENALHKIVTQGGGERASLEACHFAVAALSGLPRVTTFEPLIPLLSADDPELRQLALVGLQRQCYQAWKVEREGQMPANLLHAWLEGFADSSGRYGLPLQMVGTYQNSLHAIVDTFIAKGESVTEAFRVKHPDLARELDELFLVQGQPTVEVPETRRGTIGRRSALESYTNLWSRRSTATKQTIFPSDRKAKKFSFSLQLASGPNLEADPNHSPMTSVRWKGAAFIPRVGRVAGRIEFDNPLGGAQVTLTCPTPEQAVTAKVTLKHEAAARWFMPYRGRSRIEIRIGNDEPILIRNVSFEGEQLRLNVPRHFVAASDELELTIQFVSGTTVYWLREVVVEFMDY